MRPKLIQSTNGNANGVALSPSGHTIYLGDTGVLEYFPTRNDPNGARELWAYDFVSSVHGAKVPVLTNQRMLNTPINYFYDGIRVSIEGWILAGSGDGVDLIDPETGLALGSVRIGGGEALAVSLALGWHEFWIVGRGGIWRVSGLKTALVK